MVWQDWALLALTPIFFVGLIPSMVNPRTQIPRSTSVPTAFAAWTQAILFASLSLTWTAAGTAVIALGWTYLAAFRALPPTHPGTS